MPEQTKRRVVVNVDLDGSRLGPEFLSVELSLAPPDDWTDDRIRQETATYYAVPTANVAGPWPKTWDDDEVDDDEPMPCIDHGIVGCGDCDHWKAR